LADIEFTRELQTALQELTNLVVSSEPLEKTLERVSSLSVKTIPGCVSASITVMEGDNAWTPGSSDELALELDRAQYESGRGPCLEAIKQDREVLALLDADDSDWPEFSQKARSRGIHTSFSVPMKVNGTVGGLNLYAQEPDAFDEAAQEIAHLFGNQAAVALENARLYWGSRDLIDQLTEALKTREIIGEAKGILMEREGVDDDGAFDMLRRASQTTNTKLREVAQRVVDEAGRRGS
jgi:GAF domain-containing protein